MSTPPPTPPAADPPFPIYAATNGHVVALNAIDGVELWRRKLPGTSSGAISILSLGDDLYVAAYGHVYCLNRHNGDILWKNDLKGLGYQSVTLACEGVSAALPVVLANSVQQTSSD